MSSLSDMQESLAKLIEGTPYLAAQEVIVERGPEITDLVNKAIGRLGFFVGVGAPELRPNQANDDFPSMPHYLVTCTVALAEQPTLNKTGLKLHEAVEALVPVLHGGSTANPPVDAGPAEAGVASLAAQWRVVSVEPEQVGGGTWGYTITCETRKFF